MRETEPDAEIILDGSRSSGDVLSESDRELVILKAEELTGSISNMIKKESGDLRNKGRRRSSRKLENAPKKINWVNQLIKPCYRLAFVVNCARRIFWKIHSEKTGGKFFGTLVIYNHHLYVFKLVRADNNIVQFDHL